MPVPEGMVPAKYIGERFVALGDGVICYNVDGTRKTKRALSYGDTLLLRDEDIYGKTLWHDPQGVLPSLFIGIGHVVRKGDEEFSREELVQMGYEFHVGRNDMEALEPLSSLSSEKTVPLMSSLDVPQEVPVEDKQVVEEENNANRDNPDQGQ